MAKADILTELAALGINETQGNETIAPLTGKETVAELEAILDQVKNPQKSPTTGKGAQVADFSFAVNVNKLNRAKAYVQQQQVLAAKPALKGKELQEAVKDRYAELGGLLVEDKPNRGRRTGRVQNLADNDDE